MFTSYPAKVVINSVSMVSRKGDGFCHMADLLGILDPSLITSFQLGHVLDLAEPQCHYLQKGGNYTYLTMYL